MAYVSPYTALSGQLWSHPEARRHLPHILPDHLLSSIPALPLAESSAPLISHFVYAPASFCAHVLMKPAELHRCRKA